MSRRAANQMASVSDRQLDAAEMSAALARADALLRAAAGAVFCIACANVTMLLLARGSARAHETATRVALGCARHHLAQQLFADSLIVALAGGAAGALLAPWTVWMIAGAVLRGGCVAFDVRARPARDRGGVRHLRLRDDRVLTRADLGARYFADVERAVATRPHVATTAWAATLPGSPPVVQSMRIEPRAAQVRDVVADALPFTRELLAQVAARPIAGRMFAGADTADACRVVLLNAPAAQMMFAGDAVGRAIVDAEGTRLEVVGVVATKPPHADAPAVPMVYHYADQMPPPFGRGGQTVFHLAAAERPAAALDTRIVSLGYFASMGLSLDAGRLLPDVVDPDACRVAVVNREAADRYLDGNAVGAAVIGGDGRRAEIAGEVGIGFVLPARRALGIDPWSILAER